MVCLRCGKCCTTHWVIIVDDPEKGLREDNLIEKPDGPCKHLVGTEPGKFSCAIHDKKWYKKTPCWSHGQVERSKDDPCRLGKWYLEKGRDIRDVSETSYCNAD